MRMSIIFLTIFSIVYAQDWECEKCPPRSAGLYDCDVQIAKPDWGSALSLSDWLEFKYVACGMQEELFTSDPSRDCLSFYDGQFVSAAGAETEFDSVSYQTSYNWQNLPGSGSLPYVNYIVYGSISQSDGYSITVNLETGPTRELVASNTVPYNFALSGVSNGKAAVQFLKPLMGKIREFEKQKRNERTDVAIEAELKIQPQKFYLETNSSTLVKLELKDCDDFKLPDRQINLTASSGTLSAASVTTDENGEAEVTFTAGSSPAWVEIYAEYVYYYPHGAGEIVAADIKFISVQKSPVGVWDLSATVNVQSTSFADTTWSINIPDVPTITDNRSQFSRYSGRLKVFGLITNECGDEGSTFCYSGSEAPLLWFAFGDASEFSKQKETEYLNGELKIFDRTITLANELAEGSEMRNDNYNIRTDQAGVYLEYSDDIKYFDVSGYGEGEAMYHHKEWIDDSWKTNEGRYSLSAGAGVSWDDTSPGGSFTYQNSKYTFSYSRTETTYSHNFEYGTIQTTTTKNLNGTLKPYEQNMTGIADESFNIPAEYSLGHNYPNPFNARTVISYRLPLTDHVTLTVYDILGRQVTTLVNEIKTAGIHETAWDGTNSQGQSVSSGIYYYQLKNDAGDTKRQKMILLK